MQKKKVYFNEYNIPQGKTYYLPIVSGKLHAFALEFEEIRENYEFAPYNFYRDSAENILSTFDEPAIAAFSICMWNEQLSLHVASEVKKKFPDCLILFGGPQVPHNALEYMKKHTFIDAASRGEGEHSFVGMLQRNLVSSDFSDILGICWRDSSSGECHYNEGTPQKERDLDVYPSPYLNGCYDYLMRDGDKQFQAIVETNRGCPFSCAYCYWGHGGLNTKYSFYSLERVAAEIEWCGQNKIAYVFNADSNFGMHKRDAEIVDFLIETKKKYDYPEKFRTCYGKNTDQRIYEIAYKMHCNELDKGITLARQSDNPDALRNVGRKNIKSSTYTYLQKAFNDEKIPVYTEFILGLPGETRQSWIDNIGKVLASGLQNQLFIYCCQVYPNTTLGEQSYQAEHGVKTKEIVLHEIHGAIKDENFINEYENIIVETSTMSCAEWQEMLLFSWVTMTMHSLKTMFFVALLLNKIYDLSLSELYDNLSNPEKVKSAPLWQAQLAILKEQISEILEGKGRGRTCNEYGAIYWDQEEAAFLEISKNVDLYYEQMHTVVTELLNEKGIDFNEELLTEAFLYQKSLFPRLEGLENTEVEFQWNIPEYMEKLLTSSPVDFTNKPQILTIHPREYNGNPQEYARKVILWGRKSGKTVEVCSYKDM